MEIDERIGGLAVIPGLHKGDFFHDRNDPPQYRIPQGALPAGKWHRSLYRPGDMVMFHKMTPHSGLPNTSDRFRMSMDVRVAPMTGELPIIGEVRRFADDARSEEHTSELQSLMRISYAVFCSQKKKKKKKSS